MNIYINFVVGKKWMFTRKDPLLLTPGASERVPLSAKTIQGGEQGWELIDRNRLVRDQCEVASCQHAACEIAHKRGSLEVEVTEHFVGLPSSEESDDVSVDIGAQ